MPTRAEFHTETAQLFLLRAQDYLAEGDLLQASEKGWGAAAQSVKAAAEVRGLRHRSHRALFRIVRRVADESDDSSLVELFDSANALHQNFYEGLMPADTVAELIEKVVEFVGRMNRLEDNHDDEGAASD